MDFENFLRGVRNVWDKLQARCRVVRGWILHPNSLLRASRRSQRPVAGKKEANDHGFFPIRKRLKEDHECTWVNHERAFDGCSQVDHGWLWCFTCFHLIDFSLKSATHSSTHGCFNRWDPLDDGIASRQALGTTCTPQEARQAHDRPIALVPSSDARSPFAPFVASSTPPPSLA